MGNVVDISLNGESLKRWNEWVLALKKQEWLLSWAINVNRAIKYIAIPIWMAARIIGIPLTFIDMISLRLITIPFRAILVQTQNFVIRTSIIWERMPMTRPALIIIYPIVFVIYSTLASLIPYEPDVRNTKYLLAELWPLSSRRIGWIEKRGNDEPVSE